MNLIERLEALEAPCRECDVLIDAHRGGAFHRGISDEDAKSIAEPATYWDKDTGEEVTKSGADTYSVPHYTASIDAAMALVPEGWRICNFSQHDHKLLRQDGEWMCSLYPDGKIDDCNRDFDWPRCDNAPTPAIALCIAALRAQETANGR